MLETAALTGPTPITSVPISSLSGPSPFITISSSIRDGNARTTTPYLPDSRAATRKRPFRSTMVADGGVSAQ